MITTSLMVLGGVCAEHLHTQNLFHKRNYFTNTIHHHSHYHHVSKSIENIGLGCDPVNDFCCCYCFCLSLGLAGMFAVEVV